MSSVRLKEFHTIWVRATTVALPQDLIAIIHGMQTDLFAVLMPLMVISSQVTFSFICSHELAAKKAYPECDRVRSSEGTDWGATKMGKESRKVKKSAQ